MRRSTRWVHLSTVRPSRPSPVSGELFYVYIPDDMNNPESHSEVHRNKMKEKCFCIIICYSLTIFWWQDMSLAVLNPCRRLKYKTSSLAVLAMQDTWPNIHKKIVLLVLVDYPGIIFVIRCHSSLKALTALTSPMVQQRRHRQILIHRQNPLLPLQSNSSPWQLMQLNQLSCYLLIVLLFGDETNNDGLNNVNQWYLRGDLKVSISIRVEKLLLSMSVDDNGLSTMVKSDE